MNVDDLYQRLDSHYDVRGWWPAGSPWEVIVGALLTQQTAWENVERVLTELKMRELLTVEAVDALDLEELQEIVRPAGFFRQKARNIKAAARYLASRYGGDPSRLLSKDLAEARAELKSLPGIGDETADVILLFAGDRPKFVAAVYVSRILNRLGIFPSDDYGDVQRFMESTVLPDPRRYAHLYALMVHHARTTCRSRPRCEACFLRGECEFSG